MAAPGWFRPSGLADLTLEAAVRRHIAFVLGYTGGDKVWAAEELGIHRTTLARWLDGAPGSFRPGAARQAAA